MKRQHDQGNLLKKAFNLGLTVPEGSRDYDYHGSSIARVRWAWSCTLADPQVCSSEGKGECSLEMLWAFKTSKPTPSDSDIPPKRPHY